MWMHTDASCKEIEICEMAMISDPTIIMRFWFDLMVQYLYLANEGIVALLLEEKSFIKFIE